ncbi:hypothetical protein ACWCOV_40765 [Kribbella sp. NPDC002412]
MSESSIPASAPRRGVLIQYREARKWGRGRLARELERVGQQLGLSMPTRSAMEKAIYRHETGQSQVTDEVYIRLYCAVYECSPYDLFGDPTIVSGPPGDELSITSNKFMPAYVGPDIVEQLGTDLGAEKCQVEWSEAWRIKLDHPRGECILYGFPWGCLLFHIEEQLTPRSIAEVAVWRHGSYPLELEWTDEATRKLTDQRHGGPEYAFSAFWVTALPWHGEELQTALRLLCNQKSMLNLDEDLQSVAHAELVERAFLRDGYNDSRILDFGASGISYAYASWSAVTYFPIADRRALNQSSLVEFEIMVQSLWCYCHHIRTQVESGRDPQIPDGYDWRWVRGVTSRMLNTRPQETTQHLAMRTTILKTSELDQHLNAAVEILKDVER